MFICVCLFASQVEARTGIEFLMPSFLKIVAENVSQLSQIFLMSVKFDEKASKIASILILDFRIFL